MRPIRDFRPQQLYGVTQRGNQGQWVYRDDQDFRKALDLMKRYAARYGVNWRQYSRLVLDAQSWALDFRGVFREFHLEFDARYAELLFAIFESQISERALEVVGTVDFVWSASS